MHLLPRRIRTRADDRGTALVEFAFVGVIFFALLFGIIAMSVLLAVKQNMTQAASEAARAAIAVEDQPSTTTTDERRDVALSALQSVVTEFEVDCTDALTLCQVKIHECNDPAGSDFNALTDSRATDTETATVNPAGTEPTDPCMTTFVEFQNTGDNRVLPPFPIISGLEPDTITSQSTVHLVPVPA